MLQQYTSVSSGVSISGTSAAFYIAQQCFTGQPLSSELGSAKCTPVTLSVDIVFGVISRNERFYSTSRLFLSCSPATQAVFTAAKTSRSCTPPATWACQLLGATAESYTHIAYSSIDCILHCCMQNPLTSRATVIDCSDRQNGAQVPKAVPVPEPKLKPDVRPGKVTACQARGACLVVDCYSPRSQEQSAVCRFRWRKGTARWTG